MSQIADRPLVLRLLAIVASGGIAMAVVLGVFGHVVQEPHLDPITLTISDYAISDRGGAVDIATVILALASLALLTGLLAVRAPVRGAPTTLILIWCAGLLASVAVPTDPIGTPEMSTNAYIHRYVSVSAFVCLPIAAALVSARVRGNRRWQGIAGPMWALVAVSALGLLALTYVAFPGDRMLIGLVERTLVVAEIMLLGVLALKLHRVVRSRQRLPA